MKIPLITRICIGYEGYECETGISQRFRRCTSCRKQHLKLWHREYGAARRARDKARKQKVEQGEARQVCYTHSKLQWMGEGRFIRVVSEIVRGEARYVG